MTQLSQFAWFLYYYLLLLLPYLVVQSTRLALGRRVGFIVSASISINWQLIGALYCFLQTTGTVAVGGQISDAHIEAFSNLLGRYGYTYASFAFQLLLLNLSPGDYMYLYRAIRMYVRNDPTDRELLLQIARNRNLYQLNMTGFIPSFTPELSRLISEREIRTITRSYIQELQDEGEDDL